MAISPAEVAAIVTALDSKLWDTVQKTNEPFRIVSDDDGRTRCIGQRLFDQPLDLLKELRAEVTTLYGLTAELPSPHRHQARVLLDEMAQFLDSNPAYEKLTESAEGQLVLAEFVYDDLSKAIDRFRVRLQTLARELKVWLPAAASKIVELVEPLRSDQAFLQKRLNFCCPKRTKTPPDSWSKIYNDYNAKFPKDTKASSGSLRLTHTRHCPKCKKQGGQ